MLALRRLEGPCTPPRSRDRGFLRSCSVELLYAKHRLGLAEDEAQGFWMDETWNHFLYVVFFNGMFDFFIRHQKERRLFEIGVDTAENEPSKVSWNELLNFQGGLNLHVRRVHVALYTAELIAQDAARPQAKVTLETEA